MNSKILLAVSALIMALPALAHDVEKGPHGGRVVEVGSYHVELVAKDNVIDVFLTDAGEKPLTTKGFKGVAILVISGKSARVTLEPADDARLTGKAAGALPAQPNGVVQITSPQGATSQARFH